MEKRKRFKFSHGLINPAETAFDIEDIEPWAQWQNNLDAKVLVIGQEFCDVDTYNRTQGKVERYPGIYEYPSNANLAELCASIGLDPGHPSAPNRDNPLFFTNAVMGLKPGTMSSNFKDSWLKESRNEFLKPLIEIIQPEVIISIGRKAASTLGVLYGFPVGPLFQLVQKTTRPEMGGPTIFHVYHTGGLGLAHRKKELQKQDWLRIKATFR